MASKATVNVPDDVADVLRRMTFDGVVAKLPPGQLDRKLYEKVNAVLTAIGGKWNRNAGGHVFPFDPQGFISDALGTGKAVHRKKALQFFETPEPLAQRMADLAKIGTGNLVLEPSAGTGRLARAAIEKGGRVVAVDIDPTNVDALRGLDVIGAHLNDFLLWRTSQGHVFDAVIMNPPFTGNQDIRHIQAAWGLLRPGGRLVAIASAHAFIGQEADCAAFRAWIGDIGATVELLPAKTFAASGTDVATWLISATKPSTADAADVVMAA